MKIALFGKKSDHIKQDVIDAGFEIVEKDPEIVISYGGDGTFLKSEHAFPEVPKVLLKNSETCRLCTDLPIDEVLNKIKWSDYNIFDVAKLKVSANGKEFYALNDVVVHNNDPRRAIRFDVEIADRKEEGVIGDGIVVATEFGSTGYYKSITKTVFNSGVGVAFNNTQEHIDPIITSEEDFKLKLKVIRGPVIVYADNIKDEILLSDDDVVEVETTKNHAKVLILDTFSKPMRP